MQPTAQAVGLLPTEGTAPMGRKDSASDIANILIHLPNHQKQVLWKYGMSCIEREAHVVPS
jgi:hypothetical protein